jgi:hypothetical protein
MVSSIAHSQRLDNHQHSYESESEESKQAYVSHKNIIENIIEAVTLSQLRRELKDGQEVDATEATDRKLVRL